METAQAYAVALAGIFVALFFMNNFYSRSLVARLSSQLKRFAQYTKLLVCQLSYIQVLPRIWGIGPCHLQTSLLYALFFGINAYLTFFSGFFRIISADEASSRGANLAMITLVPVLAGPSQSFLASSIGVSFQTYQKIHVALGLTSLFLVVFHVISEVSSKGAFPSVNAWRNLWAVIVST